MNAKRCRGWLALPAVLVLGCRGERPHEPRGEEPAAAVEAEPSSEAVAPTETSAALPRPPSVAELLPPPPEDANACEASCGALHGCLILDGQRPQVAASIEIGCLENCIAQAPPRDPPFGCERPEPRDPSGCAPFRTCVADSWVPVEQLEPANPFGNPGLGAGCERVCQVYATCRGLKQTSSSGDREAIDKCIERCEALLPPDAIQEAEDCTRLGDCAEIKACLEDIPRAH